MADERCTLESISWIQAFPFVRLFATFKRAVAFRPMVLAFCCVLATYVSGRVLDAIWASAGGGVLVVLDRGPRSGGAGRFGAAAAVATNEIEAYATRDDRAFHAWKRAALDRQKALATPGEANQPADHAQQVADLLAEIDGLVRDGLRRIDAYQEQHADEKAALRQKLLRAADIVRLTLAGIDIRRVASPAEQASAVEVLLRPVPGKTGKDFAKKVGRLSKLVARHRKAAERQRLAPRGPFIALLDYEMNCFAAAIQGVLCGRWGFDGSALSERPAMLGSIASAGNGVVWLVTQRPTFTLLFGVILLVVFSYFGGGICRICALQATLAQPISIREALRFSRQKFAALCAAPVLPIIIFAIAWILTYVGGLIAAIPTIELLGGLVYGLTLLGGVAMTATLLAVVLGFPLMWPNIAVEASDAFDAVQHAASYVFSRAWHVAFYAFTLLLYGGVCFGVVRIIAALILKLAHDANGAGMNTAHAAGMHTIGKLDAMWRMPAWNELPLLPAVGDNAFWGHFHNAPLNWAEYGAMLAIACYVFVVVGLVGAFVVSFYYCGATEMYLLLRRTVDGVDYDEIYYEPEEPEAKDLDSPGNTPATHEADTGDGDSAPAPDDSAESGTH